MMLSKQTCYTNFLRAEPFPVAGHRKDQVVEMRVQPDALPNFDLIILHHTLDFEVSELAEHY